MPDSFCSSRPAPIQYASIAALYEQYRAVFIGQGWRRTVVSECGLEIVLMDRHFLHLICLKREGQGYLNIQEERAIIASTAEGLGPYQLDPYRARHLPSTLDCIASPDYAIEVEDVKTGQIALFKHYGDKPYPVMQVMIGSSYTDKCLIPVTAFPTSVKQARTRIRKGRELWRKKAA